MDINKLLEAYKEQGLGEEEIKQALHELYEAIGQYLEPKEEEKEVNDENIKEVFGV